MTHQRWYFRSYYRCYSLLAAGGMALLSGCAAGSIASTALELVGIRQPPELPESQQQPRKVAIRLHASSSLNTDASGHSLALVARIYKLRQSAAFQQMPYESFLNAHTERDALGSDLVEVKEVLLVPGQHLDVQEKVPREAAFIGVVALFRAPAEQRWRISFAASDAEKSGITVGAHACALSIGSGAEALGASQSALNQPLSNLHCL